MIFRIQRPVSTSGASVSSVQIPAFGFFLAVPEVASGQIELEAKEWIGSSRGGARKSPKGRSLIVAQPLGRNLVNHRGSESYSCMVS